MSISDWQQRLLDQESGKELDRAAERRQRLAMSTAPELAGCHEVSSIDLARMSVELQNLANLMHELQKKLIFVPHVAGLREALSQARVAFEIGVICAKDASREMEDK